MYGILNPLGTEGSEGRLFAEWFEIMISQTLIEIWYVELRWWTKRVGGISQMFCFFVHWVTCFLRAGFEWTGCVGRFVHRSVAAFPCDQHLSQQLPSQQFSCQQMLRRSIRIADHGLCQMFWTLCATVRVIRFGCSVFLGDFSSCKCGGISFFRRQARNWVCVSYR